MGPYQVLTIWVRVDMEAMAMKGYSTFLKSQTEIASLSDDNFENFVYKEKVNRFM